MPTFVAWGNIQQDYPFEQLPLEWLTNALFPTIQQANSRVQRRQRCRKVAYFLLAELLKKIAKKSPALFGQIHRTASGRPYFANDSLDFNISHSGDWVAVVLNLSETHRKSAVGIDIESPQRQRPFANLLAHFAPQTELTWFAQQPQAADAFYRCWCLREAILKSQGVGIVKLAEVQHDPAQLIIQSAYCPTGQLIFSANLPFYFALFVEGEAIKETQFFHWQVGGLQPAQITNVAQYQVNVTKSS